MASLVGPDDAGLPDLEQQEALRLAQRMREEQARRGELVANAGHELKTPLSIILGLSGRLLSATDDGSAERRDAERIRANAYGLLKHVDDLLQAARIEDGRVVVEPVDCDVAALVRDVTAASRPSWRNATNGWCSARRAACRPAWTRRSSPPS